MEDYLDDIPAMDGRWREAELDALTYNGHLYAFPVGYLEGAINGPNVKWPI